MLLPIRTETSVRHAPTANVALITLNIVVFLVLDFGLRHSAADFKERYFILDGEAPKLIQYITYQFSHADTWHLLGNMLFLWVFGNAVNAKFGDIPYVLFYLAGGIFSAMVFTAVEPGVSLLRASGSIAAVTTAYLVLFPRSHVTVLYFFFLIGVINVPAPLMIVAKIVIWDNLVAPMIGGGSNVAHAAHIAGYLFGFIVSLVMLLIRALPRDQFDMLALFKRWNQRRAYTAALNNPAARAQAQYGRVARVAPADPRRQVEWERQLDERTELRAAIAGHLERGDTKEATAAYDQLVARDPEQCLPADQQMAVGREYYASGRFPQAAAAFERYLNCYRMNPDANEVRLLLGIINARELQQFEAAEKLFREAVDRATSTSRRELAQRWLDEVRTLRGGLAS